MSDEQASKLATLEANRNGDRELADSKYAAAKDVFSLETKLAAQAESIKGLEKRFEDKISSDRSMRATNISTVSLIIAALSFLSHYLFK